VGAGEAHCCLRHGRSADKGRYQQCRKRQAAPVPSGPLRPLPHPAYAIEFVRRPLKYTSLKKTSGRGMVNMVDDNEGEKREGPCKLRLRTVSLPSCWLTRSCCGRLCVRPRGLLASRRGEGARKHVQSVHVMGEL
jgi:hypothetical protein